MTEPENMTWMRLTEALTPPAHTLVLLRMKNRIIPERGAATHHVETSGRSLMVSGREYGYQLGILRYAKDGFGRLYPDRFEILSFTGNLPEFQSVVQISDVTHWATLT